MLFFFRIHICPYCSIAFSPKLMPILSQVWPLFPILLAILPSCMQLEIPTWYPNKYLGTARVVMNSLDLENWFNKQGPQKEQITARVPTQGSPELRYSE